jgi:cyclophilin family peptidyl-prolyl cis-trans isomerase
MHLAALLLTLAQAASPGADAPAPQPAPQPTPPPATRPTPSGPFVALEVVQGRAPLGTITIGLDAQKAPISVENFMAYVRAGHYDGTTFHRVMPGFMIQGGGYTPELEEKPTRPPIQNEARNGLRNSRGTVAMARLDAPNSATSQFFINLRDNHRLDFGIAGAGYAVFALVVDGMDVVDRIATVPTTTRGPHENVPQTSVIIRRVREVPAPAGAPQAPAAAGTSPPKP